MIWCDTKAQVTAFEKEDYAMFIPLHQEMERSERLQNISNSRNPMCRSILVATDRAARDLEIGKIDLILQLNFSNPDRFMSRIRRTERAGDRGKNVFLVTTDKLALIQEFALDQNVSVTYKNSIMGFEADIKAELKNEFNSICQTTYSPSQI